jgi:F-type H+-transporting ATPase subunit b
MLIDWFTVGAQALNFVILVWLMKRFLYHPILHAIDKREQRIAAELAAADTKKKEAKKEQDEFQQKNEAFDQQRDQLLRKAKDEAQAERGRLFEEASQEVDALRAKRQEALKNEFQSLRQEITRRSQKAVFAIARKMLLDLAGIKLEQGMSEMFIRRLQELNDGPKETLAKALKTSVDPVLVRSAFELPSEQQAAIQQALNATFASVIQVRFETAPEVISGIELSVNGWRVAWNSADYLALLEKSVDQLLQEKPELQTKVESKPKPKPQAKLKSKPQLAISDEVK